MICEKCKKEVDVMIGLVTERKDEFGIHTDPWQLCLKCLKVEMEKE